MENAAAIELRDARKHFGPIRAVDGVDLRVERGEVFGLIGHNGAGKSTLFKMMLGLIAATGGDIRVAGAPVQGHAARAARRQIGYLPENLVLYDNLSGLETLHFFARLKKAPLDGAAALLARVGLEAAADRPVRGYSKGMRQRLGFAQALLGAPRVLFLDEPTNGLDPAAIRDFYGMLEGLRARGVTILITSHILAELQQRVDRLAIMVEGRIQALGSVPALRAQIDLPLVFTLHAEAGVAEDLRVPLAGLQGAQCEASVDGASLTLRCPRAHKMAALSIVMALGRRVRDLDIREPTLEDLFFGIGR
ncbi:MAG: ABC transporter ATP-binding protein [Burkholderiaceae bacterium]|jgi:Cu-processing system ATP-binding protein|nr:ABC transporter ATP-binding protein [Burkholderiaceae bacterium]